MMDQFEVITINGGERYLTVINLTDYDFYLGFRRVVIRL